MSLWKKFGHNGLRSLSSLSRPCVEALEDRMLLWFRFARATIWLGLGIAWIALLAGWLPVAQAGFTTAPTYAVGIHPSSIAVGDFNGDGMLDLVTANLYDGAYGTVSVLLGNGDGTFQDAQSYGTDRHPISVIVADLNGDGKLDLAVVANGSGAVNVLIGNGDGTFQAAQAYTVGFNPWSVTVGDFNGDGIPDLAVANSTDGGSSGTVSILLGNGDGTFQDAQNYDVGIFAQSVAVGDFNGDGRLDLAVANFGSNTVSILLGHGDGTFERARSYAAGSEPFSVAVGDFNGDGILDVVTANRGSNTVSVLLGNGDGTFQGAHNYAAGRAPNSVAVGDLNGDGHLDLVVTDGLGNQGGPVSILLGKGDGTFQAAHTYTAGSAPDSVAIGDFNGDGHLDLAVANANPDGLNGTVSILLGKGDGTFPGAQGYAIGDNPRFVAVGDFNGDGVPDLAVANRIWPNGLVSLMLGKGDGTFRAAGTLTAGPDTNSVAVGDFNGDGKADIVTTNFYQGNPPHNPATPISQLQTFLGEGDSTFHLPVTYQTDLGPTFVVVGDFNGDGIPDLAVAIAGGFLQPGSTVNVFLGNGNGTFQAAQSYATNLIPSSLAVGDFNGDGHLDLAVAGDPAKRDGSGVSILLGNGDGTFQAAQNYAAGVVPISVAVGDFNGDGFLDLAVANFDLAARGTVSVLLGNGDGTFQDPQSYPVGGTPVSVAVADFNKDGHLDLAVVNRDSGTVSVLLGNGDGTFNDAQNYAVGNEPVSIAVGDFNGDGYPDLAVANNVSGTVTVLLNDAVWP